MAKKPILWSWFGQVRRLFHHYCLQSSKTMVFQNPCIISTGKTRILLAYWLLFCSSSKPLIDRHLWIFSYPKFWAFAAPIHFPFTKEFHSTWWFSPSKLRYLLLHKVAVFILKSSFSDFQFCDWRLWPVLTVRFIYLFCL